MKKYKHFVLIMGFLMVFNLTGFFPLSFSAENETSRAPNKDLGSVHVVTKNVVPEVEHVGSDLTSSLSVGWIALISGLIGALITALLNYMVNHMCHHMAIPHVPSHQMCYSTSHPAGFTDLKGFRSS